MPPLIKAFTWRLIRRALATAERVARYSTHIDQHCAYCGAVENDFHLFFQCNLPRAVCFTASPPLRIDALPPKDDGVQLTLPRLITPSSTDDLLCNTIFTMWYIWKARNDNRFQRKTWNPWQVHHAVAAHLNTHKQALLEVIQHGQTEQLISTAAQTLHHTSSMLGMDSTNAGTSLQWMRHHTVQVSALLPGSDASLMFLLHLITLPSHLERLALVFSLLIRRYNRCRQFTSRRSCKVLLWWSWQKQLSLPL